MRKKPWRSAGLLAAPLLCLILCLGAICPARAAAGPRFHVDAWGPREGLTANEVIAITQTRDGYLWLGTMNGLIRFDGVQFKVFDEHNTPDLPSGVIVYLFEDSKSNLWIGTQNAGALLLQSNHIIDIGFGKGSRGGALRAACEDATGVVWLRSDDGELARYRDGKLERLGGVGADHTLIEDKSGTLFFGTDEINPTAFRGSLAPAITRVSGMSNVDYLLASRTGGRWCMGHDGIENMVEKWEGSQLVLNLGAYPWGDKGDKYITAAAEDMDGNLILGTRGAGVWWFDPDRVPTQISQVNGLSGNVVLALHMDNEGGLWVGLDGGGLNRVQRQLFQPLEAGSSTFSRDEIKDLPAIVNRLRQQSDEVSAFLWMGLSTADQQVLRNYHPLDPISKQAQDVVLQALNKIIVGPGIFASERFKGVSLRPDSIDLIRQNPTGPDVARLNRMLLEDTYPLELSRVPSLKLTVRSVAEDAQGRLWFSSSSRGVDYWKDESVKNTDSPLSPMSGFNARALLVDRDQNIWAATFSYGLFRWGGDRFLPGPDPDQINPSIYALHQDRSGNIWAGTAAGLACWDGHRWRVYAAQDGLSANIVRAVADDAAGNLWIGTEGGGLFRLRDGKISPVQTDNGFPSKNISALYSDHDGVLWAGTLGNGLIRLKDGHCVNYTTDTGLNGNGIAYILDDDQGCLWLGSNAGLMRVKKSDLNAFADGTLDYVPCRTYGERDGLPSDECTRDSQPAACRAADGTLWFPTIAGLVPIEPSSSATGSNMVPVLIESVLVDGEEQGANGPRTGAPSSVVVPAGKELLEIHYTGLNFADPKQVRFQFLMENYDARPRDAGEGRVARYPKLPPGQYQFQVRARNEDGLWNPVAATLAVNVLPAYWQTKSFRGLVGAGLLAALTAFVYYISTQRLQRQLAGLRQQQALEKDRARIARDIHDQVGASLTQLSLLGEMIGSDKDDPAEVEVHAGQITQTARETAHALDEIVWTVNPSNDTLEGLVNYICKHAQEYLAVAGLRYRIEAPAQLPAAEVSPEARHNVFLAAKESVTNIVKHARATEACIRLRLEPKTFTLEIEDDGRGPTGVTSAAAQSRNGMRNMRKRMEDIGGKFEIGPGAKGGTLVRLTAPFN